MIEIQFLGAAQTVTGSKHLLRTSRATVPLDCDPTPRPRRVLCVPHAHGCGLDPGGRRAPHPIPYHRKTTVARGVELTFLDAGHVLGSGIVVLDSEDEGEQRGFLEKRSTVRAGVVGDAAQRVLTVEQRVGQRSSSERCSTSEGCFKA